MLGDLPGEQIRARVGNHLRAHLKLPVAVKSHGGGVLIIFQSGFGGDHLERGARRIQPLHRPVIKGLLRVLLHAGGYILGIEIGEGLLGEHLAVFVIHHHHSPAFPTGENGSHIGSQRAVDGKLHVIALAGLPLHGAAQPFQKAHVKAIEIRGKEGFRPVIHVGAAVAHHVHRGLAHRCILRVDPLAVPGGGQHHAVAIQNVPRDHILFLGAHEGVGRRGKPAVAIGGDAVGTIARQQHKQAAQQQGDTQNVLSQLFHFRSPPCMARARSACTPASLQLATPCSSPITHRLDTMDVPP